MRRGPLALLLVLAATIPLACSGDDEEAARTATDAPPAPTTTVAEPSTTEPGAETAEAPAEEEAADPQAITDAAERTAAAGSARVATEVRVSGAGVEQTFGGEGLFDFAAGTGRMELDLGGVEGSPFASAEVVFVDYDVFYGLPPGILPSGRSWLQLDLQSLVEASAVDFGALFQGGQADPAQYLLWLRALGPDLRRVGEEAVRGAETTHYRGAVDLDLLAEQGPEGREAEWKAYVEATRQSLGTDSVPVEVWVDGDGLVRRLRQEHTLAGAGGEVSTQVTMELYDFGVEVDVSPPPADEVAAIGDLIRP